MVFVCSNSSKCTISTEPRTAVGAAQANMSVTTKSFAYFDNLGAQQQLQQQYLLAVDWVRQHFPFWNA